MEAILAEIIKVLGGVLVGGLGAYIILIRNNDRLKQKTYELEKNIVTLRDDFNSNIGRYLEQIKKLENDLKHTDEDRYHLLKEVAIIQTDLQNIKETLESFKKHIMNEKWNQ